MTAFVASAERVRERLLSPAYRGRFLLLLLCVCTLNYIDRAVLSATVEPIKAELKLTDFEMGMLQGLSFALLYTIMGVPFGRLAERFNRLLILAISVTTFSFATLLCGFASSFLQLFLLRMTVGVGEAGFLAPTNSLISDHFPARKRASALSIVMLGSPIGYLVGAVAGGWIADHYGWRSAFLVMGLPGFLFAVLLLLLLREPPRGLADGTLSDKTTAPSFVAVLRFVFVKPSFRHILIGGMLTTFGVVAIGQFQLVFFVRGHGLSLTEAGFASGLTTAISLSLGTLVGGFGVDWANRRDMRWSVWVPALGITLAAALYSLSFLSHSLPISIAGLLGGGIALFVYYAPTYAMAQNLVGPRMRATAVAILAMTFGLVGAGLGPTFLGFASDLYSSALFNGGDFHALCPGGKSATGAAPGLAEACRTAASSGIRYALASTTLAFFWAAIHYLLAARTLVRDLYRVPEHHCG